MSRRLPSEMSIVQARVIRVEQSYCLCELLDFSRLVGLLHISQMNLHGSKVQDAFALNDVLHVQVISIITTDQEGGPVSQPRHKIKLSTRYIHTQTGKTLNPQEEPPPNSRLCQDLNSTIGMSVALDPMATSSRSLILKNKNNKSSSVLINGYALVGDNEGEQPSPQQAPIMGRGRATTLPEWMAKSSHNGLGGDKKYTPPMGRGRGTTLPAWMTRSDNDNVNKRDEESKERRRSKKEKKKHSRKRHRDEKRHKHYDSDDSNGKKRHKKHHRRRKERHRSRSFDSQSQRHDDDSHERNRKKHDKRKYRDRSRSFDDQHHQRRRDDRHESSSVSSSQKQQLIIPQGSSERLELERRQGQVELLLMERISNFLQHCWGESDLVSVLTTLHAEDSLVIPLLGNVDALGALIARHPNRIALRQDTFGTTMAVLLLTNAQWAQQELLAREEELAREERILIEPSRAEACWFYKHLEVVQGPFRSEEMREWLEDGYFQDDLPISQQAHGPFMPIRERFPDISRAFMLGFSNDNLATDAKEQKRARNDEERLVGAIECESNGKRRHKKHHHSRRERHRSHSFDSPDNGRGDEYYRAKDERSHDGCHNDDSHERRRKKSRKSRERIRSFDDQHQRRRDDRHESSTVASSSSDERYRRRERKRHRKSSRRQHQHSDDGSASRRTESKPNEDANFLSVEEAERLIAELEKKKRRRHSPSR